jgi:hypothetical protein
MRSSWQLVPDIAQVWHQTGDEFGGNSRHPKEGDGVSKKLIVIYSVAGEIIRFFLRHCPTSGIIPLSLNNFKGKSTGSPEFHHQSEGILTLGATFPSLPGASQNLAAVRWLLVLGANRHVTATGD